MPYPFSSRLSWYAVYICHLNFSKIASSTVQFLPYSWNCLHPGLRWPKSQKQDSIIILSGWLTSFKSYGRFSLTEVLSHLLFTTALTHDSPIFQHCLWRICLTPSLFSLYPSLLTLFHLKMRVTISIKITPRTFSPSDVFPSFQIKIPACFWLSVCRWMSGFQSTCNIIKHSSSSLSILLQSPGATASCPSFSTCHIGIMFVSDLSKLFSQSVLRCVMQKLIFYLR